MTTLIETRELTMEKLTNREIGSLFSHCADEQIRNAGEELIRRLWNSEDLAIDCMCIWEYYCDGHTNRMDKLKSIDGGAYTNRQYVHDSLAPFCNKWYIYARDFLGFDDSYDWEFIPPFLDNLPHHDISSLTLSQIGDALGTVRSQYFTPS